MAAKLVHQTEKHDWYKNRYARQGMVKGYEVIFNIVPKGDPIPVTGYFSPRYIMDIKGYKDLKVGDTFEKVSSLF